MRPLWDLAVTMLIFSPFATPWIGCRKPSKHSADNQTGPSGLLHPRSSKLDIGKWWIKPNAQLQDGANGAKGRNGIVSNRESFESRKWLLIWRRTLLAGKRMSHVGLTWAIPEGPIFRTSTCRSKIEEPSMIEDWINHHFQWYLRLKDAVIMV